MVSTQLLTISLKVFKQVYGLLGFRFYINLPYTFKETIVVVMGREIGEGTTGQILNFLLSFICFSSYYSSIISSLNAAPIVHYRYQLVVSISFTTFRMRTLISKIIKKILSDLQQKSCFSCKICATTDRKGEGAKSNDHRSCISTVLLSLLFRTGNVFFYFHFTGTGIKKNFSDMY